MHIRSPKLVSRRRLLGIASVGTIALITQGARIAQARWAGSPDAPGSSTTIDWSALTESRWRERLTAEEFRVLREEGTERPYTSRLNDEKRPGTYVCAGCALPLFDAAHKYDSGTGWPSFWQTLPGAMEQKRDFKLIFPRTEYHCSRCGGHQGHVFEDGPPPTGQRWCNNGVALGFVPEDAG